MKWKCPKCGREFSRQSQDHYCIKPQSVDEYIAAQDETIQQKLNEIRTFRRYAIADAEERISWSMPTYRKDHNIIHFAAQKKHIGLYPGPEAVAYFSGKLDQAGLLYSKGSIQIPYSDDLPLELIAEIADWCRSTGNHA